MSERSPLNGYLKCAIRKAHTPGDIIVTRSGRKFSKCAVCGFLTEIIERPKVDMEVLIWK
jgi:ribosomal protein L34E